MSAQPKFVVGMGKTESPAQFSQVFSQLNHAYQQQGQKPLMMYARSQGFVQPDQAGQVVANHEHAGGFMVYTLSNGVEVWFQQDEQAGNRAYVYYASQGGKAALQPGLYPAFEIAALTAARSGLGEFSGAELDSQMRKQNMAIYPLMEATHHGFQLEGPRENLAQALNVLYNAATEIKVEPRQLEAVKQEFYQNRHAFFDSSVGRWVKAINHSAYQENSRYRLLSSAGVADVTPD